MNTLEEILKDCQLEAENTAQVIDKMIGDSKRQGVQWPEVEPSKDEDNEPTE